MQNTNFIPAQSVFSNGQITGNSWGTPNNIFLVDQQYATSNVNTGSASDFIIGNFNLNLPQDAVPTGIEIEIIGHRGAQTSPVISLDVSLYDNTNGASNFYPYSGPITSLTPSDSTIVIGGQNYLFASSFTVDQINNLKLALTANGDISLDSVLVRAYYFIQTPVTPPTPTPGVCIDCSSPIQVQAMYLELPFLIGQTKFYLRKGSFSYPNGIPVQPGDVGSCGGTIPFVFDESKRKMDGQNFEENAMLDTNMGGSWTVLPSGVIEVDLVSVTQRGLDFKTPAAHIASNMSDHDANSKVIISNNEPYNLQLVRTCQVNTVFSAPIIVENQNVPLPSPAHDLDFVGAGVSVVNDGTDPFRKIITIPGAGGTTPPQVVSTTSNTSGNVQVTTLTALLQISGLNRGVPIQISTEELQTVVSVDVGGTPATSQAVSTDVGANLRQETWFCPNPPLGPQIITVTLSGAAYLTFGAECVNGIDPVTPIGTTQTATGTSLTPSLLLATGTDYSIVIDGLATAQTPILYTPGAGQASNWSEIANTTTRQGGSSVESAGLQPDNITMDYAITQNTTWCLTAIEIKGITSAVSGLEVDEESVPVELNTTKMDFRGSGVTVTPGAPGEVIVTVPGSTLSLSDYQFDDTVSGVPAIGFITYDDANPSLVTQINVNNLDSLTVDHASEFSLYNTGDTISIADDTTPGLFATYIIVSILNTGAVTEFTVTYSASVGTFTNNDDITISLIHVSGTDEKVKATGTDTTPGYLDPKLNIHSSNGSVTVSKTITNPGGNEIVDYDLSASGSVVNVSAFDDFLTAFEMAAAGTSANANFVSGNFVFDAQAQFLTAVSNHPGIIRITSVDLVGFGLLTPGASPSLTKGQLDVNADFNVEILTRLTYGASSGTCSYSISTSTGADATDFNMTISNTVFTPTANVDGGAVVIVPPVKPASGDWFKVIFDYTGGVLTITVNGSVVYTAAAVFSGSEGYIQIGGSANAINDVDYVKTNYVVVR